MEGAPKHPSETSLWGAAEHSSEMTPWDVPEHPLHLPDLPNSDFHLFPALRKDLGEKRSSTVVCTSGGRVPEPGQ